jgi:diguanylate cyclase (GGDEF)-like protein/PAS domain S-box-containing protein
LFFTEIKKQNGHFKNALLKLSKIESEDLNTTFKKILKIANKSLNVSRSSIWLYKKEQGMIECAGIYAKKHKKFLQGKKVQIEIPQDCIKKLELKRPIVLQNEKENLVCAAFQKYMQLSKISSFLITPFVTNAQVIGIMVNAAKHESYIWDKSKIDFSMAIANSIALNIEVHKRKENEEKFNNIAEVSLIGLFIYNEHFVYANKAFQKMTGYSFDELQKLQPWQIFEPEKQADIETAVKRRLRGERFFKEYSHIKIVRKDGAIRWMRIAVETIMHDGRYAGAGSIVDITETLQQKEKVALLAKALEYTDKLVYITDISGHITYVNDAFVKISGYTQEELLGEKPSLLQPHAKDERFYRKLWNTILSGEMYHDVVMDKTKDGSEFYVEFNIAPILGRDKKIEHFIFTGTDVSKRIKIEHKLKQLATIDSLTKVYNRYKINEIIEQQIARSKRYGETFSVVMFDIDYFKKVNDTYGHYVGDLVLKKLSELISQNIREVDSFGRWGGEEFMLLLHKANKAEAVYIAEKLRKMIQKPHSLKGWIKPSMPQRKAGETGSHSNKIVIFSDLLYKFYISVV